MAKVTPSDGYWMTPVGNVSFMEEQCPICGGDDVSCPYGDWSFGDVDDVVDTRSAA